MKPLNQNKNVFTVLSLYPIASQHTYLSKYFLLAVAVIIAECLALVASALFIYFNLKTEIENCLYALFQMAALISVIYMWIIAYVLQDSIVDIFTKFEWIYDSSKFTHFAFRNINLNFFFILFSNFNF